MLDYVGQISGLLRVHILSWPAAAGGFLSVGLVLSHQLVSNVCGVLASRAERWFVSRLYSLRYIYSSPL